MEGHQVQLSFIQTAAAEGVDSAIAKFGDAVTAREAAAIRQLAPHELKGLADLHTKISQATAVPAGAAASDWACGAVC